MILVNKKRIWRIAFSLLSVVVILLGIFSYQTWVNYRYHLEVHQRFQNNLTGNYDDTIVCILDYAVVKLDTILKEGKITYHDSFELEDMYESVAELQLSCFRDVQYTYLHGFYPKDIYGTSNPNSGGSTGLFSNPFFAVIQYFTDLNNDFIKSSMQQKILDRRINEKISLILEKTNELLSVFKENHIPYQDKIPLKERVNKRIEKLQKIAKFYNENELVELNKN